jgi:manganese/iron transport system permease protein
MFDWLLAPLHYAFMVRGLLAAVVVGIISAVLGTYMVLRGMAFFGDALAHAVLPGVAVGYLVGSGAREPVFWWAMATALLSAFGIGAVSRAAKIKQDTAIGIIFAGMFALGVALISLVRNYTADLTHFLFGDVLGVNSQDLLLTIVFGVLILLIVIAFYKEFLIISFDPTLAATLRLPIRRLEYLLIGLIAMSIVVSLQIVGVTLMVAMLITPAATASLLTRRLSRMMLIAALLAVFSGITGLYLSYYLNIASGAAIVLTCTLLFAIVWSLTSIQRRLSNTQSSASV